MVPRDNQTVAFNKHYPSKQDNRNIKRVGGESTGYEKEEDPGKKVICCSPSFWYSITYT